MRWLVPALAVLLAACGTVPHTAPVQERSPVISRETVPPVLGRASEAAPALPPAPATPSTGGSARTQEHPVLPRPPSGPATAGMMPPQALASADPPVAIATPLRPDGGRSNGAAQHPATAPAGAANGALPALEWSWPVDTPISQTYSEAAKGIDFSGAAGQPVRAAAAGEVIYVGNSLRGYGRLVVVKHDKGYSSVYAHNRQILVKEGQHVERGQRIAEMGNSDSKEVTLHFELRRLGHPLDPTQILPPR